MTKFDEALKGLSPAEKRAVLKGIQGQAKKKTFRHDFGSQHFKFGYFSDSHIGHKMFSDELWDKMVKFFKREKIKVVYSPGDILEGMSGREGHIYELSHIGATAQIHRACELIPELPEVYAIAGNHDLWYQSKGNAGFNVLQEIETRCSNFHYLGDWEADVILAKGVLMKLYHGNDGSAYATSYKIQKLIESFTGGEKPNIVLSGHYHKALYTFIRNVHAFECGTICGQTRWMRGKKIAAHMGFGSIEMWVSKGIERLRHEFVPYYQE